MHSKNILLGLATAFAPLSLAHTTLTTLFVDNVNQGAGTCIRVPHNGATAPDPIKDLSSPAMACGVDGQTAVDLVCPAAAGSKITFQWKGYADAEKYPAEFLDDSHKGPVAVYLKSVSDFKETSATGPGWFKIWEEGYDEEAGKWATEKIMPTGLLSVGLPTGLTTGSYLIRTEILTLQNVTNGYVEPQFYVACAQLQVQGSSTGSLSVPSDRSVAIPGHVSIEDENMHFNFYEMDSQKLPYVVGGPKPFVPSSPGVSAKVALPKLNFAGAITDKCIVKNANWCGSALPEYSDETGCWKASDACYKQLDECYDSAPATGSVGCKLWDEQVCKKLQEACRAGGVPFEPSVIADPTKKYVPQDSIPPARAAPDSTPVEGGGNGGTPSGDDEEEEPAPSSSSVPSPTKQPVAGGGSPVGDDIDVLPTPLPSAYVPTTFATATATATQSALPVGGDASSSTTSAAPVPVNTDCPSYQRMMRRRQRRAHRHHHA